MRSHAVHVALGILAVILASGTVIASAWAQAPTAPPAPGRLAAIGVTALLQDHSEQSIKAAIKEAAKTAVRGALAMGPPWIQLVQAYVDTDMVTVQILASDTEPGGEEEAEPGSGRGLRPLSGELSRLDL